MAKHNLYDFHKLIGKRFGRLVVIDKASPIKEGTQGRLRPAVLCRCDCGDEKVVRISSLMRGACKSCGCYARESASKRLFKHGMAHSRLFSIWNGMIDRCHKRFSISYKNYGERGISVCKEWREDFSAFHQWAINNGYKENLTIDRIDNNKGYEPTNCKWSSHKEQARNRRSNHFVAFNGVTKTITEWSELVGIKSDTIWRRIKEWDNIEKALTQPVRKVNSRKIYCK